MEKPSFCQMPHNCGNCPAEAECKYWNTVSKVKHVRYDKDKSGFVFVIKTKK